MHNGNDKHINDITTTTNHDNNDNNHNHRMVSLDCIDSKHLFNLNRRICLSRARPTNYGRRITQIPTRHPFTLPFVQTTGLSIQHLFSNKGQCKWRSRVGTSVTSFSVYVQTHQHVHIYIYIYIVARRRLLNIHYGVTMLYYLAQE